MMYSKTRESIDSNYEETVLFNKRIVIIDKFLDSNEAKRVCSILLKMDGVSTDRISIYLCCFSGLENSIQVVIDMIKHVSCAVEVIAIDTVDKRLAALAKASDNALCFPSTRVYEGDCVSGNEGYISADEAVKSGYFDRICVPNPKKFNPFF